MAGQERCYVLGKQFPNAQLAGCGTNAKAGGDEEDKGKVQPTDVLLLADVDARQKEEAGEDGKGPHDRPA